MWEIRKEKLTDSSTVWNVTNGDTWFHCPDEKSAQKFLSAIDDHTLACVRSEQLIEN